MGEHCRTYQVNEQNIATLETEAKISTMIYRTLDAEFGGLSCPSHTRATSVEPISLPCCSPISPIRRRAMSVSSLDYLEVSRSNFARNLKPSWYQHFLGSRSYHYPSKLYYDYHTRPYSKQYREYDQYQPRSYNYNYFKEDDNYYTRSYNYYKEYDNYQSRLYNYDRKYDSCQTRSYKYPPTPQKMTTTIVATTLPSPSVTTTVVGSIVTTLVVLLGISSGPASTDIHIDCPTLSLACHTSMEMGTAIMAWDTSTLVCCNTVY